MQKILILAANPKNTTRLRLDEELRDIEEGLRRAQHRDRFALTQRLAVRPRDIQRAMLEETPQIVHFSGHGDGAEGLMFEDEGGNAKLVSGAALAGLFALFADPAEFPDPIHCVVLNGCYSVVQAEAIADHVPYVVGMTKAVGDRASIEFAVGFYDALGAGRTVEFAFKLGCAAIDLAGKPESATPLLINKKAPPSPPSSPSPSSSSSSAVPIPQDRTKLYQFLLSLPGPQFDAVVFDLNPPRGNLPPSSAPQGDRVSALLNWVESPIGPATKLEALRTSLDNLLNPQ
ncbi:CHAT domain-containing protein [Leptolyngbya sp. CCNP1308]|uniref:CHAT domain-containing protein n=1 Tax=Leptolyngbya sp. CCNP1308 TaxID=3110255 RepID=UPI002B1F0B83|nr:CHAT domain-containing protein [Leptolyngbya sp. CCNP1308]MEA5452118.1 CHAT domain-containing protein [Leptolyngbya sp. CCNP1308]